jgi:hypothetical protein
MPAGNVGWSKSDATGVRGTFRWLDADRGNPGPYGSNPIGAFAGVDTIARGADTEKQVGLSAHMPWGRVLQGRVQQRFAFTWGDFDNRFHGSFGDSTLDSRRTTFRAQTDLAASPSTGLSFGIEALGERARSTYVVGEQGRRRRSSGATSARSSRCGRTWARARRSLPASVPSTSRATRWKAIRTASRRGRRSPPTM